MLIDSILYVIRHLRRRKLRSWLTLISIFIGMAAVVALVSLSEGLQDSITTQFARIGYDRIIINPAGAVAGPFSGELSSVKLTEGDVKVVKGVNGVEFTAGLLALSAPIKFKDEVAQGFIVGAPTDAITTHYIESVGLWDLAKGRNPRPEAKYETVVGSSVAGNGFKENITLRDRILINGTEFRVVGIGKSTGTFTDRAIRIPKDTARELFNRNDQVSMIVVKVLPGFNTAEVAESIRDSLRSFRGVKKDEEDFNVETSEQVIKSFLKILGIVQVLIVGVAAISLVVGGVGIMNTMYTAVVERTREIGIMKAIGAKNRTILAIFLIESGTLGLTGGALGVILGLLISKGVEKFAEQSLGSQLIKAHISLGLVVGVLAFSFVLGALAGYFPAKRASKMQPTEALRH